MPVPWRLKTERLHLVRPKAEHIDHFVQLDSDPEVMRFISAGEPSSKERYDLARRTARVRASVLRR